MIELYLLLLFMIAAAIIAVEIKDLLSSIVAVGAVGLGLSLTFLALKAPDLAIVQLVVEILGHDWKRCYTSKRKAKIHHYICKFNFYCVIFNICLVFFKEFTGVWLSYNEGG